MSQAPSFTVTRFTPVYGDALREGLIGYVSGTVSGLEVDGIMVRRSPRGEHHLSYPSRTDSKGRRHHLYRPSSDSIRRSIERQVLSGLGLIGGDGNA